jgi:hypothetical protein
MACSSMGLNAEVPIWGSWALDSKGSDSASIRFSGTCVAGSFF